MLWEAVYIPDIETLKPFWWGKGRGRGHYREKNIAEGVLTERGPTWCVCVRVSMRVFGARALAEAASCSQSPISSILQKQLGLSSWGCSLSMVTGCLPESVNANTQTRGQVWREFTHHQRHGHLGHLPLGSSFLSIKYRGSHIVLASLLRAAIVGWDASFRGTQCWQPAPFPGGLYSPRTWPGI